MARSLDPGSSPIPTTRDGRRDDGWPYPDDDELDGDLHDPADPTAETDDEILSLHGLGPHLLDGLDRPRAGRASRPLRARRSTGRGR